MSGIQLKARRALAWWHWVLIGLAALLIALAGAYAWYQQTLLPVNAADTSKVAVEIKQGMLPEQIAGALADKRVVRSASSFLLYTRLAGVQHRLQVGSYELSPSMSTPDIADILAKGKSSQMVITFYPGATLYDPTDTPDAKRTDVYTMLRRAGFGDAEVRAALAKQYTHPLFAGKPAGTSLEGYVYGETYHFAQGSSIEAILTHTFDTYYRKLQEHTIVSKAKAHGLNLYQAITLASIIEREVHGAADQRQVAQIFYSRLAMGISLGSDVTFIYAAEQQNKQPTVDFPSPYNTRIHGGLPPGPIATPGLTALEAVGNPAKGDYLYFIAGDDGKTYFARDEAGHQTNIERHCQKLCYE